ncbi:MAG: hypothetical protein Q4P28_01070 [Tissierellia bacterium]|nr:hypothetical protein [Tissierellia bacterium]
MKILKKILMALVIIGLLSSCNKDDTKKQTSKEEVVEEKEEKKDEEEGRRLEGKEREERLNDLLNGEEITASETVLQLNVLHQINQQQQESLQRVNAFTNYKDGEVDSQELMIEVKDKQKSRMIYNEKKEFKKEDNLNEWTMEKRDEPSIYLSVPEILNHLQQIQDHVEVRELDGETMIYLKDGKKEIYEILKNDFHIIFDDIEEINVYAKYLFDNNGQLEQVEEIFRTANSHIRGQLEVRQLNKVYPIMGEKEIME